MPTAAARPCRHVGCGALVRDGSGFCLAHQADKRINRFGDDRRGTAAERGYGHSWAKLRARIMRRDAGLCQPCLQVGRVMPAHQVDHVVPKTAGGTDAESNLQAICTTCHKAKTSREATQGRGV